MSLNHKHRRLRAEDHVDDWLMTYADMITLLLCFFAVLLSLSAPRQEKFDKARAEMAKQFAGAKEPEAGPKEAETEADQAFRALSSFVETYQPEEAPPPDQRDRITVIDMDSAALFARGSASLSDEGRRILRNVAERLSAGENADYQVTVEGHTDDTPIRTFQFPSNWELSTARAAAVVRFFIEQGIPARRLRAAGYADSVPKVPNRDAAGVPVPENQAQNRRVVIKLEKIEKAR